MLRRKKLYKSAIVESRLGFTLMELMVVIAILAVLMAIAVPTIANMRRGHEVSGTLREVLTTLQLTRIAAIKANAVTVVIVDADADTCEAFVDDGGSDLTDSDDDGIPDSLNNGARDPGEERVGQVVVPERLQIDGDGTTILRFNGRGFSVDASGNTVGTPVTVQLSSDTGGSHTVTVYPTGHSVID